MTELDVQTKSAAPLFSVVVPVYNGDCSLAQTLDSVLQQDYDSYELVVVDDGSTDTSGEIIRDYARRYPNRVHAHHQANVNILQTVT